jgi:hypothetical protein
MVLSLSTSSSLRTSYLGLGQEFRYALLPYLKS